MENTSMFSFTESELLAKQITHARFLELLNHSGPAIHTVRVTTNLYGEFQFVTISAQIPKLNSWETPSSDRRSITFWGLGYHDSRERWLCDEWRWHPSQQPSDPAHALRLSKPHVLNELAERHAFCRTEAQAAEPASARAQLFALFADLGDEDGATTMLEDMEMMGVDVDGLFDE
ncbi:MAG: hypothetical protein HC853_07820 [Anaerolineae bacterium]|nr:hypothetical protein [Anaerolineae bacterium]